MKVTKAKLVDVPALAWTSALAFTRLEGRDRPLRAALEYFLQLTATLGQQNNGSLFHHERSVMVGIENRRKSQLRSRLVGSMALLVPMLAVYLVISPVAGPVVGIIAAMVVLFVPMVPAFTRMLGPEARTAERVHQKALNALPEDRLVYTYTQLARRLTAPAGSAQELLREVLDQQVPPGAAISCIAADRRLIPIYERFGLRQQGDSLAMLTPEPSVGAAERNGMTPEAGARDTGTKRNPPGSDM